MTTPVRLDPLAGPPLRGLFPQQVSNGPALSAILLGRNPGVVLVERADDPAQCMVRDGEGWSYCSASIEASFLHAAIARLRQHGRVSLIWPPSRESGGWPDPPSEHLVVERVEFPEWRLTDELQAVVTAGPADGARVEAIGPALFERCLWKDRLLAMCGSARGFVAHGFGYCVIARDGAVASESYAPFLGESVAEVGVITNERHRGRGYARVAAAHVLLECRRRGLQPYWSCDRGNAGSIALARRLGFAGEAPYRHLLFE